MLIETLDRYWADHLSKLAADPDVCGPKPTPLFWFTPSELLLKLELGQAGRPVPSFLKYPNMIFESRWVTSEQTKLLSLLD